MLQSYLSINWNRNTYIVKMIQKLSFSLQVQVIFNLDFVFRRGINTVKLTPGMYLQLSSATAALP